MANRQIIYILSVFFIFNFNSFAYAYIGPGLGVGGIIIAIGILGAILLAIFGFFYYPIKKIIMKIKTIKHKKNNDHGKH